MRNIDTLQIAEHALELAVFTYAVTERFPREERYGLTDQMRRASVSVGSNIAEGCSRWTDAQFLHFLSISSGSTGELEFQCRLAQRLTFGDEPALIQLRGMSIEQRKMTLGYANWLKRHGRVP